MTVPRAAVLEPAREVPQPCPRCGQPNVAPNGAFYRRLRLKSKITLTELARLCKCSAKHLSRMERGESEFKESYVEVYMRLLDRRRKSGDES